MSPEELKEYNELSAQSDTINKRIRELTNKQRDEQDAKHLEYWDTQLKGKIFYANGETFPHNFQQIIQLVKITTRPKEIGQYTNIPCKIFEIHFCKDAIGTASINKRDSIRWDTLYKSHQLLTAEKLTEIKEKITTAITETLKEFDI